MALQECGLNLDRNSKELKPHGKIDFPCAGYSSSHTDIPEDVIPWHWHEEMEIINIIEGNLILKSPEYTFRLEKGQTAVINSNIIHYAAAEPKCALNSLVFSPALISGEKESVFAKKYIRPLLSCHAFSACQIDMDVNEQVSEWFSCAFDALANDSMGYEFIVRENLSRICLYLYEKFEPRIDRQSADLDQDNLRIQRMLNFLHNNYSYSIGLKDISKAADVSERECLRCFKKMLDISPIQYLLKYRAMQGAMMLGANSFSSISEVAARCGFDSPSNFAKIFKRFYKCTPREYRKNDIYKEK